MPGLTKTKDLHLRGTAPPLCNLGTLHPERPPYSRFKHADLSVFHRHFLFQSINNVITPLMTPSIHVAHFNHGSC